MLRIKHHLEAEVQIWLSAFNFPFRDKQDTIRKSCAERMMFTAYYLRRAVGRANFITDEPESAPVSPRLDRQERPSVCRTRVASLSTVERALRSMKSVDLKVNPIYVLLCTPAYYVEWHMRAGAGCYSVMKTTMRAQAAPAPA